MSVARKLLKSAAPAQSKRAPETEQAKLRRAIKMIDRLHDEAKALAISSRALADKLA